MVLPTPAPADLEDLVAAALAARERAYAPYSDYPVGAALLVGDGRVFAGCNIENAAYPATICAERAAVATALAAGARDLVALAVIAAAPEPVPPCGLCRQVLAELGPQIVVVLANTAGERRLTSAAELLPGAFGPADLRPERA
ncbi:MAG: cytidine deaminase [Acidimicrobiia bacterium]|nr:cytidine deaminase [Acidimicrobiia bacterium]